MICSCQKLSSLYLNIDNSGNLLFAFFLGWTPYGERRGKHQKLVSLNATFKWLKKKKRIVTNHNGLYTVHTTFALHT